MKTDARKGKRRKQFPGVCPFSVTLLHLAREINDQPAISESLFYLGTLALERGQVLEAAGLLVDGLKAAEAVGEPVLLCFYLNALAHVLLVSGVLATGIERAADVVLAQRGAPWYIAYPWYPAKRARSVGSDHRGTRRRYRCLDPSRSSPYRS